MQTPDIIAAVKEARAAGLSVVPCRQDGTKAPVSEWKHYQEEPPAGSQLKTWYVDLHHTGIGYVTGRVSGIECFEFDDAGTYEAFKDAADRARLGELVDRIEQGYSDRSPAGGVHWYYRCDTIEGNQKLAERPGQTGTSRQVLIETRGEGGYVIAAPSYGTVHPSRKPYTALYGSPSTIATITPHDRADLFQLARTFDEIPPKRLTLPKPPKAGGERVGDVFNARAAWSDILEPHGWQQVFTRGAVTYWRRPGKDCGVSATTNHGGHDALYVFTSSTVFEPDTGYHKLTAFVMLNHDGDWKAAIRDLASQGYVPPEGESAGSTADGADGRPSEETGTPPRLLTRKASDIEPRDIEWVWPRWLPFGMVGLFAGYGGSGKSTLALDIAAAGSVGGTFPDGTPAPLFNTLVFAAEDSPEHTTVPRLQVLGADLSRIHIVDGIATGNDEDEPGWIRFQQHVPVIEQAVRDNGIGLVIIDPISSYIGDANSDKESDVRNGIMPLVRMAERTGAAVLMIRHVSKGGDSTRAASRILGSTAWHDVPRIAWMLADAPQEHQPEPGEDGIRETRRVLGVVKSNLAAKPAPRWYLQRADGRIVWYPNPSPVSIDECFQPGTGNEGSTALERAENWLSDFLKGGMKSSVEVEEARKNARIGEKAYKRARQTLKVEKHIINSRHYIGLPPGAIGATQLGQSSGEGAPVAPVDTDSPIENAKTPQSWEGGTVAPVAPVENEGGQSGKEGNRAIPQSIALVESAPLDPEPVPAGLPEWEV